MPVQTKLIKSTLNMRLLNISFCFFVLIFLGTTPLNTVVAQKFGHLNLGNLLEAMPEREKADKELMAYGEELSQKAAEMEEKLEKGVQELYAQIQSGTISQLQVQEREQALQTEQQALQKYEQESMLNMEKKRRELLGPLIEKVQLAIDEVGKENGYEFIFDSSIMNAVLYAGESDDVLPLVRQKLGL